VGQRQILISPSLLRSLRRNVGPWISPVNSIEKRLQPFRQAAFLTIAQAQFPDRRLMLRSRGRHERLEAKFSDGLGDFTHLS
jgi:hypothetical protein